ncbi:MAG: carboxymuconolactone decarboxylase family protein [Gemmatimonadetes bacterium]|nr:carboxymuconolactone decarboxylase family protein [Gemmatimonadota bacterium]
MRRFQQYTIANAPGASRSLLQQVDKTLGFIPALFATIAESPAALEGSLVLDASLAKGGLSAVERQLVEIAVSTENRCAYCVAAHSTIAAMLKAQPEIIAAVRAGDTVADPKIDALVTFTRAVMRSKGFIDEAEIAVFFAAGYDRAQLIEVVAHIGLKTMQNYVHALTGAPLDPEFVAQQWDAEELSVA